MRRFSKIRLFLLGGVRDSEVPVVVFGLLLAGASGFLQGLQQTDSARTLRLRASLWPVGSQVVFDERGHACIIGIGGDS